MLIEVKVKVSRIIDPETQKTKWTNETYVVDRELFAQAEFQVESILSDDATVFDHYITSLRCSVIKEVASQFTGEHSFIATLRDTFIGDDGVEKHLRYKVLLWADDLTQANQNTQLLAREGYDMLIEGIKQVDYVYINEQEEEDE